MPEAQTVKSILKSASRKSTQGLEKRISFNPVVYKRTQIFHDKSLEEKNPSDRIAVQQNQEAIVAENQFNQFTKEFTERTHQLTAREQSDDFETQRFILDECNIILGTEIPELLNKNWQLLSNRQSKLEILRQHKVLLSDWKKFVDSRERKFHTQMQNEQPL